MEIIVVIGPAIHNQISQNNFVNDATCNLNLGHSTGVTLQGIRDSLQIIQTFISEHSSRTMILFKEKKLNNSQTSALEQILEESVYLKWKYLSDSLNSYSLID